MSEAVQSHGLLRDLQNEIVDYLRAHEMFSEPPMVSILAENLGDIELEIQKAIGAIGSGGGFVIVSVPEIAALDAKRPFLFSVTVTVQCLEKSIVNRSTSGNQVWGERLGEKVHLLLRRWQSALGWTYLERTSWESGQSEQFPGHLADVLTFTADTVYDTAEIPTTASP